MLKIHIRGNLCQQSLRFLTVRRKNYRNDPTLLLLSVQLTHVCNTHSNRVVMEKESTVAYEVIYIYIYILILHRVTAPMKHLWRCHCSEHLAAQDHTHLICRLSGVFARFLLIFVQVKIRCKNQVCTDG